MGKVVLDSLILLDPDNKDFYTNNFTSKPNDNKTMIYI